MADTDNQETELDLTHYIDVLLRRRWIVLAVWAAVQLGAAFVTFTTKPVYQASVMLVIEKERGTSGAVATDGTMIENNAGDYYPTQYKLLKSDSLTQKVYDDLGLKSTEDFQSGLGSLQGAVTIAPVLGSRLLYIQVNSHSPELAARVANGLAKAYVEQNLTQQLFISKEVLQALQIKEDSSDARKVYESLPAVVNNPLLQTLKGEYVKMQASAANLGSRYTPKHPAMVSLRADMAAIESQIRNETDKVVQSLKTELSGQLKGNNVRIIDPAKVPGSPIKPRKQLALMLGLAGGIIIGFAFAFLVEMMDQSIRTQEDVENKIHLPFLGHVPFLTSSDKEPVYRCLLTKESSMTSEAFRNLRTMVDFARVSDKTNALLVTSAVQGEGKTYVASNLAAALAQMGDNVLLIDGDLRRPSQHKIFGISSKSGLSDYLASGAKVEDVQELIQPTELPNLKVLPCGPIPPNPAELLNTPRLTALSSWFQACFDRVIIDCTPMFPISDTLLWGRLIRSAVFVVRYGKTRAPIIRNARQRLETSNLKILGAVINGATYGGLAYVAYGRYDYYQHYYHEYAEAGSKKA